jgi:hypothetical protein
MTEKLQQTFKEYTTEVIKDFVRYCMPDPPLQGKYKYFKIKTSDNYVYYVWGKDEEEILSLFERFLDIRIFI